MRAVFLKITDFVSEVYHWHNWVEGMGVNQKAIKECIMLLCLVGNATAY